MSNLVTGKKGNPSKDMMQLYSMYRDRDVKTELRYMSSHVSSGYLTRDGADFIRWLFHAALRRIEDLEKEGEDG